MDWPNYIVRRIRIFENRRVGSLTASELKGLSPWLVNVQKNWHRADEELRAHFVAIQQAIEQASRVERVGEEQQSLATPQKHENEELERKLQEEVQSDWRNLLIGCIEGLNGKTVGALNLSELEWIDKTWMPKIRMRWREAGTEGKRTYFAMHAAIQSLRPNLQIPPGQARAPQREPEPSASPQQQEFVIPDPPRQSSATEISAGQPPPAPIGTPKSPVSDVRGKHDSSAKEEHPLGQQLSRQTEQPEQVPLPQKEEEPESYQRTPLNEIIGKYGIKSVHWAAELLPTASDEEFTMICADVESSWRCAAAGHCRATGSVGRLPDSCEALSRRSITRYRLS